MDNSIEPIMEVFKEYLDFYDEILDFLEGVYSQKGIYSSTDAVKESRRDMLILNFTKVVNDCRAIVILMRSGYLIQAGIILRSTIDAMHFMMYLSLEPNETKIITRWKLEKKVKHYDVLKHLNQCLDEKMNENLSLKKRKKLDDLVHANFQSVKLYPVQAPGPTPINKKTFSELIFWWPLLYLNILSCLLCVQLIDNNSASQAEFFLKKLVSKGWSSF